MGDSCRQVRTATPSSSLDRGAYPVEVRYYYRGHTGGVGMRVARRIGVRGNVCSQSEDNLVTRSSVWSGLGCAVAGARGVAGFGNK